MSRTKAYEDTALDFADRIARLGVKCAVFFASDGTINCRKADSGDESLSAAQSTGRVVGYYTHMATERMIHDDIQSFLEDCRK